MICIVGTVVGRSKLSVFEIMLIDDYDFGKIIINGETYHTDVIVFPDHVREQWWRQHGHELAIQDMKCILERDWEVLVVGTGYLGALQVLQETLAMLAKKNITVFVKKTKEACTLYNSLVKNGRNVVAVLHLTC